MKRKGSIGMVLICMALLMGKIEHVFESLKAILLIFIDYLGMSSAHFSIWSLKGLLGRIDNFMMLSLLSKNKEYFSTLYHFLCILLGVSGAFKSIFV